MTNSADPAPRPGRERRPDDRHPPAAAHRARARARLRRRTRRDVRRTNTSSASAGTAADVNGQGDRRQSSLSRAGPAERGGVVAAPSDPNASGVDARSRGGSWTPAQRERMIRGHSPPATSLACASVDGMPS